MKEEINLFEQDDETPKLPPRKDRPVEFSPGAGNTGGSRGGIYTVYFLITFFVAAFTIFFVFAQAAQRFAGAPGDGGTGIMGGVPVTDMTSGQGADSADPPEQTGGNGSQETPPVTDIYDFDYSKVPEGATPIIPMDLSLPSFGLTYIHNNTSINDITDSVLTGAAAGFPEIELNSSLPQVLIVHTHGTEAYSPEGSTYYYDNGGEFARSQNINENVVSVGAYMARLLNENGINTVHCTVMHDIESYRDSYSRSANTIKEYLRKYPSIKYVFDVHRDSIINSDGDIVRPVANVGGKAAAQVMAVIGSNAGGTDYDTWTDNLAFAQQLRHKLNSICPEFARATCLRESTYNQELAPLSILLEMGASGNSLSEVMTSAEYTVQAIVEIITGQQ